MHEQAKREAAAKRRKLVSGTEEAVNPAGLASVIAVKTTHTPVEATSETPAKPKKKLDMTKEVYIMAWIAGVNKARRICGNGTTEQWDQPLDWRFVVQNTLHKYIPFENPKVNSAQAMMYITQKLAKFGPPKTPFNGSAADMPLWYMSKNMLRRTIYKAALKRTDMIKKE